MIFFRGLRTDLFTKTFAWGLYSYIYIFKVYKDIYGYILVAGSWSYLGLGFL